jgi:hypothetical protein
MTIYRNYYYRPDVIISDKGLMFANEETHHLYQKMMKEIADGVSTLENVTVSLDELKEEKKQAIDEKSDLLIEQGITHNAVDFKINIEKEITAMGLNAARMAGADMAGKKFRAKNETYTFVDTADFDAWFNAAFARVEQVLIAGSELKDAVDAAVDQAALDLIVDDRV